MSPAKKTSPFNYNGPGIKGNLFGLPYSPATAELVIIPVPWEVTVSSGVGTVRGPEAVLESSCQIDLCLKKIQSVWQLKVSMLPVSTDLITENARLRHLAAKHIHNLEAGKAEKGNTLIPEKINEASENLNIYVRSVAEKLIGQGKLVAVVGGDHSTPLGLLQALNNRNEKFGILQVDAHADLRKGYEGFSYSHASIMHNAVKLSSVSKLVQVGIRDYCQEELDAISKSKGKIKTFFDPDLREQMYNGKTWSTLTDEIVHELPDNVYISFDIDGLDPRLCPGTGTPVPGGLDFDQAVYLIRKVALSGKKIVGFDLCEVAGGNWDATVGARMLFQLSVWMSVSQGKLAVVG